MGGFRCHCLRFILGYGGDFKMGHAVTLAKWLMLIAAGAVVSTFLWLGFIHALEREMESENKLRAERCVRMGESMPPEWEGYCQP